MLIPTDLIEAINVLLANRANANILPDDANVCTLQHGYANFGSSRLTGIKLLNDKTSSR